MKSLNDFFNSFPLDCAIGFASNGGTKRYLIEAESTTGFVAWRLDDGTTLVNAAETVDLPASQSLAFWSCAGYQDTTPAGEIVSLDCHANELNHLNIRRLKGLRFMDCCFNRLTVPDPTDLTNAQWDYLQPMLPKPKTFGRKPTHRRWVINAILYLLKAGAAWRPLPKNFPPWKTVYHIFHAWSLDGTWAALNDALRNSVVSHDPIPNMHYRTDSHG
jgi:putative transposase